MLETPLRSSASDTLAAQKCVIESPISGYVKGPHKMLQLAMLHSRQKPSAAKHYGSLNKPEIVCKVYFLKAF